MTFEEQKFFDDARVLFQCDGWKNFQAEVEAMFNAVTIDSCSNADEFWASKGARNALARVLGYENMVLQAEESAEEVDDEENL